VASKSGAIILFDFRAAFPSVSHEYLWDALEAIGIPHQYVEMLKLFYIDNRHKLKVCGELVNSVVVHSGVRQGCPLSPLLFALVADILLREISSCLSGDETVKAFADDTAVSVSNDVITLPRLQTLFSEFEEISGLSLNIAKTVMIPLWKYSSASNLRNLICELCPPWKNRGIASYGKYLGFMIGPGSGEASWKKPLQKYLDKARAWSTLHLGMNLNTQIHRTFIAPILSFVMQLERCPEELDDLFLKVVRLLAPGPGNWISAADANNLQRHYGLPLPFADPRWTALAAKLRVIENIAPDCHERVRELETTHANNWYRPFKMWHYRSYFAVLADVEAQCKAKGITRDLVRQAVKNGGSSSFQQAGEQMIIGRFSPPYYSNSRLRTKLARWGLKGVPAHLEKRVSAAFGFLKTWCNPRVVVTFFRTLWNGWVTDRRMNTLIASGRGRCCVLGCGWDEDSIEHYGLCSVFWRFVHAERPVGLGIQVERCREAFFLVHPALTEQDKVRMALGMHALYNLVNHSRWHAEPESINSGTALRMLAKKAAERSRSCILLAA
jgi:hypothetical protein